MTKEMGLKFNKVVLLLCILVEILGLGLEEVGAQRIQAGSVLSGGGSVPRPQATAEDWVYMMNEFQKGSLSTHLGIPMIYGIDAVHGNNNVYNATIFPHNIGLGATRYGVICNPLGRVTSLEIKDDTVSGQIPLQIGDLPYLTSLSMYKLTNLTGPIPYSVTKLKQLTTLALDSNSLSGPVPAFLSQLTKLDYPGAAHILDKLILAGEQAGC